MCYKVKRTNPDSQQSPTRLEMQNITSSPCHRHKLLLATDKCANEPRPCAQLTGYQHASLTIPCPCAPAELLACWTGPVIVQLGITTVEDTTP